MSDNENEEIRGDPETRKRRHDDYNLEESEEYVIKKEKLELEIPETLYFKILIPNQMIGGIIGKGGSVVNGMMVTTQAKIKISQNHEIFPDTDERIALISGTFDNVNLAIYEIISKVCELYDKDPRAQLTHSAPTVDPSGNRKYQLKAAIPIGASGSILGRGGATIRELAEKTGTRVQLVETTDPHHTRERIMVVSTTSGHSGAVVLQTIFNQLRSLDKSIGAYSNMTTNYGQVAPRLNTPSIHSGLHYSAPLPPSLQQPFYPQFAMNPILPAVTNTGTQLAYQHAYNGGRTQTPQIMPPVISSTAQSPYAYLQPNQTTGVVPPVLGYTVQIGIPDVLIGSVLGKSGSTVKDIMSKSGARITVAHKGEYMPGTTNRCMTVTGTQQQVELAQALIMHQLNIGATNNGYKNSLV